MPLTPEHLEAVRSLDAKVADLLECDDEEALLLGLKDLMITFKPLLDAGTSNEFEQLFDDHPHFAQFLILASGLAERESRKMTARMLEHATSLCRAAKILDRARKKTTDDKHWEDFSAALRGVPILQVQSAEIALKALWCIGYSADGGEPPRWHNLTKLHDALPETLQERLAEAFPEIPDPWCPHSPIPVRPGLRAVLNEHESALQRWRYAYEFNGLWFETVFDEVLKILIDVGWEMHNLWLERLLESESLDRSRHPQ